MSKMKLEDKLGNKWKEDELQLFYKLYRVHGKDWKKISSGLIGRTEKMVESLFKKNKSYLSLPEGLATAVGLIAMMNDFYGIHDESEKGSDEDNSKEENTEESEKLENYSLAANHSEENLNTSFSKKKMVSKGQECKENEKMDIFVNSKHSLRSNLKSFERVVSTSSTRVQETSKKDTKMKSPEKIKTTKKSLSVEMDVFEIKKRKNGKNEINDINESLKNDSNEKPWRSKRPRSAMGKKSKSKISSLPSTSISEDQDEAEREREEGEGEGEGGGEKDYQGKDRRGREKKESDENGTDEDTDLSEKQRKDEILTPFRNLKHVKKARTGKRSQIKSNSNSNTFYSKNSLSSENEMTSRSHETENSRKNYHHNHHFDDNNNDHNENDQNRKRLLDTKKGKEKEKEEENKVVDGMMENKEDRKGQKSTFSKNERNVLNDARKGKGTVEEDDAKLNRNKKSVNLSMNENFENYNLHEKSSRLDALATLADLSLNGFFPFSESYDQSSLPEPNYESILSSKLNQSSSSPSPSPYFKEKKGIIQKEEIEKDAMVSLSEKSSSINIEDTDEEVENFLKSKTKTMQARAKFNEGRNEKVMEEEKEEGEDVDVDVDVGVDDVMVNEKVNARAHEKVNAMCRNGAFVDRKESKSKVKELNDVSVGIDIENSDDGKKSMDDYQLKCYDEDVDKEETDKEKKSSLKQIKKSKKLQMKKLNDVPAYDKGMNNHVNSQEKDKMNMTCNSHDGEIRKRKRKLTAEQDSNAKLNSTTSSPKLLFKQKRHYQKSKISSSPSPSKLSISSIHENEKETNLVNSCNQTSEMNIINVSSKLRMRKKLQQEGKEEKEKDKEKERKEEDEEEEEERMSNVNSDDTIVETNLQKKKSSVCFHTPPNILPFDSIRAKLTHCLSISVQRWCIYEWFYGSVDIPWFMRNEFVEYLRHASLSHVTCLTRAEWGVIRSSLGKPRRLSPRFLEEERQKLAGFREAARQHYQHLRSGLSSSLPPDLSFPLMVGERVLAKHPKQFCVSEGSVLTVDRGRCRIQFDLPKLGVELVQDMDIMRLHQRTHTSLNQHKHTQMNTNKSRMDEFTNKHAQHTVLSYNPIPFNNAQLDSNVSTIPYIQNIQNIPKIATVQTASTVPTASTVLTVSNSHNPSLPYAAISPPSPTAINNLTKRAQMLSGIAETVETVAMAKAATNDAVLAFRAASNDRQPAALHVSEKDQHVNILLNLGRFLDQKQALLLELRNMNDEAETKMESKTKSKNGDEEGGGEKEAMKSNEAFQRQYAMVIVQLRAVNQQVETYLQLLRQRNKIQTENINNNNNSPLNGMNQMNQINQINNNNNYMNTINNNSISKGDINMNTNANKLKYYHPHINYTDENEKNKNVYKFNNNINTIVYSNDKNTNLNFQKSPVPLSYNIQTLSPQFHRQMHPSPSSFPSVSDITVSAERQSQAVFSQVLNKMEVENKKGEIFSPLIPPSSPLSNLLSSNSPPLSSLSSPTSTPSSSPTISSSPSPPLHPPPASLDPLTSFPIPSSAISSSTSKSQMTNIDHPTIKSPLPAGSILSNNADFSQMVGVQLSSNSDQIKIGESSQSQIKKDHEIEKLTDSRLKKKLKLNARNDNAKISKLMSSCVSTLLIIKECSDKNMPLSDVSLTLDNAIKSLHPLHNANSRTFKEIMDSLTVIKSLISTEIPSHATC